MEKVSSQHTIIPSIFVEIFSLHILLGLIYNVSSFIVKNRCLFRFHRQTSTNSEVIKPDLLPEDTSDVGKKELVSSREESMLDDNDDENSLFGRDVRVVMEKLGMKHSLEGEDDVQKTWGCKEICGLFEEEPSLEEVKEAFGVFDKNGDGFIDAEELQRVLCVLGLKQGLELQACRKMIRGFDENKDGKIDFNEFVRLMLRSF